MLGTEAFPGAHIDLGRSPTSFVGEARFRGCIALCHWLRRDVEALLPPDLALAQNVSSTRELHPIAIVFGAQTEGTLLFGGLSIPTGIEYGEFCLAIPFVHRRPSGHLHTFVPRMYSAYRPAVWSGNLYYGFGKEMARMWWQDSMFLAAGENGALLFHASVETGEPISPPSSNPDFAAMQAIFAMPVLGRKASGTYICSYFDWGFAAATVRRARSLLSIDAPLVPGLVPHECHDEATFAVEDMLWRLSWPLPCRL